MPRFWLGVLCGVLVCALAVVPAVTQQAEQIEIDGVPLQIGMAKDTVLSQIAQHGLTIIKGEIGESWGHRVRGTRVKLTDDSESMSRHPV
jgi:hypothetical protein